MAQPSVSSRDDPIALAQGNATIGMLFPDGVEDGMTELRIQRPRKDKLDTAAGFRMVPKLNAV